MLEILAWLLVLLEIQIGLGLLLLWAFRRGNGFAHLEVAGLAVTIYTGGRTAGGRMRNREYKAYGGSVGQFAT